MTDTNAHKKYEVLSYALGET